MINQYLLLILIINSDDKSILIVDFFSVTIIVYPMEKNIGNMTKFGADGPLVNGQISNNFSNINGPLVNNQVSNQLSKINGPLVNGQVVAVEPKISQISKIRGNQFYEIFGDFAQNFKIDSNGKKKF